MKALRVGEGVLRDTFALLRSCGDGKNECVVYWSGSIDDPLAVDDVEHPVHTATPGFYEIDPSWLNAAWLDLADSGRAFRVQVHTHESSAFHSAVDDQYPLVQSAGFMSLVIPRFARGPESLEDAFLVRLDHSGSWEELDPRVVLEIS